MKILREKKEKEKTLQVLREEKEKEKTLRVLKERKEKEKTCGGSSRRCGRLSGGPFLLTLGDLVCPDIAGGTGCGVPVSG